MIQPPLEEPTRRTRSSPWVLPALVTLGPLFVVYLYLLWSSAANTMAGRVTLTVWPIIVGAIVWRSIVTWFRIYKRNMQTILFGQIRARDVTGE